MLPSPVKRTGTMNPRPDWVVTFRMTGTSKSTYPADRCTTAPALRRSRARQRGSDGCRRVTRKSDENAVEACAGCDRSLSAASLSVARASRVAGRSNQTDHGNGNRHRVQVGRSARDDHSNAAQLQKVVMARGKECTSSVRRRFERRSVYVAKRIQRPPAEGGVRKRDPDCQQSRSRRATVISMYAARWMLLL
jgi:hypothetical protein